jgi:hypothetical protein
MHACATRRRRGTLPAMPPNDSPPDGPGPGFDRSGWDRCPGCGVELPGDGSPADPRRNATASCWQLYGELAGYEGQHMVELGQHHQMMVDAYGAQHAGGTARAIGPAFGLIGLYLAFEQGWSGSEVRDAHHWLAERFDAWPEFQPLATAATVTVEDVALTGTVDERAAALRAWAAAVWESWRPEHLRVAALLDERLPADERKRMHRGA